MLTHNANPFACQIKALRTTITCNRPPLNITQNNIMEVSVATACMSSISMFLFTHEQELAHSNAATATCTIKL